MEITYYGSGPEGPKSVKFEPRDPVYYYPDNDPEESKVYGVVEEVNGNLIKIKVDGDIQEINTRYIRIYHI